jgi:hypothetical protein
MSVTRPPVILPEAIDDAGERVMCTPADPRHSVLRNRRFHPPDELDALFT